MKENKFTGNIGDYTWQETDDGSQTLFSHYFDEACHSHGGAYEETVHNYIKGCKIAAIKSNPITIFEVGFGTGLGLQCTRDELKKENSPLLDFYSCEIDKELAIHSLDKMNLEYKIRESQGVESIFVQYEDFSATIFIGDIRKKLPLIIHNNMMPKVDAIYQDAFSPKRNPRLWTYEWFKDLIEVTHDKTILSTYTSTKAVWKAMVAANWGVEYVQGFNLKRWSTRAYPYGKTTTEVIELIEKTPMAMLKD